MEKRGRYISVAFTFLGILALAFLFLFLLVGREYPLGLRDYLIENDFEEAESGNFRLKKSSAKWIDEIPKGDSVVTIDGVEFNSSRYPNEIDLYTSNAFILIMIENEGELLIVLEYAPNNLVDKWVLENIYGVHVP